MINPAIDRGSVQFHHVHDPERHGGRSLQIRAVMHMPICVHVSLASLMREVAIGG